MAVSRAPVDYFGSGYSLGTNQAIFNTSNHGTPSSTEMSNTNANATTGDVCQILMAIINKAYRSYVDMASVDRPTKMTLTRSSSEDNEGHTVRTFYVSFILDEATAQAVDAE